MRVVSAFLLMIAVVSIFYFSSQSYQQQSIIPFLKKHVSQQQLKEWLPSIDFTYAGNRYISKVNPYSVVEFFFRKCAHLFVYAVAGSSIYMFLEAFTKLKLRWKAAMSILGLLLLASMDEWNQGTSVHRTSTPGDVGIDLMGGLVGILSCMLVLHLAFRSKKRTSPNSKM